MTLHGEWYLIAFVLGFVHVVHRINVVERLVLRQDYLSRAAKVLWHLFVVHLPAESLHVLFNFFAVHETHYDVDSAVPDNVKNVLVQGNDLSTLLRFHFHDV